MREYDRLPADLRAWLAAAVLPWRPRSVLRAFERAYNRTRDKATAMQELDRLQSLLVAKDACHTWGDAHPSADRSNA